MRELNEKRIIYLYEAVSCGTVRAAADKLNIAPSAVSRQISSLEQELSCILIERHRKGVKTTEAGDLILKYYKELLTQEDNILNELQAIRGLSKGHIDIAVGEGFVGDLMTEALPKFSEQHPNFTLNISVVGTNDVIRKIAQDEVHIGIIFHPPHRHLIRSHATKCHPLCVIMSNDHPLNKKANSISLSDLLDYPIALQQNSFGIRQLIAIAEFKERIKFIPAITTDSIAVLKNFVRSNMGITIMPEFVVRREIKDGLLSAIPINNSILASGEVHMITRTGRQLGQAPLRILNSCKSWMHAFKDE